MGALLDNLIVLSSVAIFLWYRSALSGAKELGYVSRPTLIEDVWMTGLTHSEAPLLKFRYP